MAAERVPPDEGPGGRGHGEGYHAAMEGAAIYPRDGRRLLAVEGSKPDVILNGILAGSIPPSPGEAGGGWWVGGTAYSAVLTPKGRMVTDLRLIPRPGGGFFLDLPEAGVERARAHFKKYMNPRFAQLMDPSPELVLVTVVGPQGSPVLSRLLEREIPEVQAGDLRYLPAVAGPDLWVLGNREVNPQALDLLLPRSVLPAFTGDFQKAGFPVMTKWGWEVLRIEAGTPLFGVDMTEDTIPVEAGIHEVAIDHQKGCYTGQEVIVRIRDRGQVSKRLRGILLGSAVPPAGGSELFIPLNSEEAEKPGEQPPASEVSMGGVGPPETHAGIGKTVGWITSSCRSPAMGQTVAMGYVKRGADAGQEVRVGGPQGLTGWVVALDEGWGTSPG